MQQQFHNNGMQKMASMQTSETIAPQMNHSAHEILDTHEVLSACIGAINEYLMCEQHIKDPELMDILHRQRQFITDQYNILVECFTTGKDPSHPTSSYKMTQSNDVIYGLTESKPTKPNENVSQLGDKCMSGVMMSCMKSLSNCMTMAAAEATNPVVRRVLQDSIPNCLEMAYELFQYQNKKGYYQLPQLKDEHMQQIIHSYAPATGISNQNMNGHMIQ